MATFVLIHGAGGSGWDWHLVEAELRARGHDVVAPDLPCGDERAGLAEYADVVVAAVAAAGAAAEGEVVVVGHSFGGFTAPLVVDRLGADLLVFVTAMVPAPGETAEEWFQRTGWEDQVGDDPDGGDVFYNDVPADLAEESRRRERGQAATPGQSPWPLDAWPDVLTRFVLCLRDLMFPSAFMRPVVADRLGIVPDEVDAGHCVALSRPTDLARLLVGYLDVAAVPSSSKRLENPSSP